MTRPTINHDPNEPKHDASNRIWWVAWSVVASLWAGTLYVGDAHWPSIALGAGTGMVLAAWATEITGNKKP